jgi:peptide/nickel transport system permease protein
VGRYAVVRLGQALVVLIIVVVLTFAVTRLIPGDAFLLEVARTNSGVPAEEAVALLRAQYGLDQPVYQQFFIWVTDFVKGDWHESIGYGQDVLQMFLSRCRVTLELFFWATFWQFLIGIPAGIVGALKRNSPTDMALTTGALIGVSIPIFFQSIVMIYLFAVLLPLFPPSGYVHFADDPAANVMSLILPGFVLGTSSAAVLARYVRSSLLEVMNQDFIRTARAKGLAERAVVTLHALKPAMIPVVTVIGYLWAGLLGGAFLVEYVFALPGLGRMMVDAVFQRDFPVIQALLVVISINVLVVNFLVDILYAYLDPRVRLQ